MELLTPDLKNSDSLPERKFLIAKRNLNRDDIFSLANAAYENLRISQQEFFVNEKKENPIIHDYESEIDDYKNELGSIENEKENEMESSIGNIREKEVGSLSIKRRREKWLEEARASLPEPGCGRVMYLVKAFEKLMTIPKSKSLDYLKKDDKSIKNGMKWALPGMEHEHEHEHEQENQFQVSSDSFCPSQFSVTSESLGLDFDSHVLPFPGTNNGSVLSRMSGSSHKSRRNSSESTATFGGNRRKKNQAKAKPSNLRTGQRGNSKQEQLAKKLQQLPVDEDKQRIQGAQGLPRKTDQSQCLVKPSVKETTKPIDLVLHSDARAMERAQYDQQMAEKMRVIERYKKEKKIIEKLAEEEEIRRLRKELIPKAQPMPFFDRPFIPERSFKLPTIPREPKFHLPQRKKMKSCIYHEMR